MKSLLSKLMLALLIIGSMVIQSAVSAYDVHFDTAMNHAHDNVHHPVMLNHNRMSMSHTRDDHPFETIDLYEHCCHSVSASVAIVSGTSALYLPKFSIHTPLYSSNLYQNPIFDSIIRPPIA